MDTQHYVAYTNGSCQGNGDSSLSVGAWGAVLIRPDSSVRELKDSRAHQGVTNNEMEILAILGTLDAILYELNSKVTKETKITIFTSSKIIISWLDSYKAKKATESFSGVIKSHPLTSHTKFIWNPESTGIAHHLRSKKIATQTIRDLKSVDRIKANQKLAEEAKRSLTQFTAYTWGNRLAKYGFGAYSAVIIRPNKTLEELTSDIVAVVSPQHAILQAVLETMRYVHAHHGLVNLKLYVESEKVFNWLESKSQVSSTCSSLLADISKHPMFFRTQFALSYSTNKDPVSQQPRLFTEATLWRYLQKNPWLASKQQAKLLAQ